jgi:putative ABC transport system permease protein
VIRFLLKGLVRDRSRSLFPMLTVAAGVMLTVFLHAWLNGAVSGLLQSTAHYRTGHVCVSTKAYAEKEDELPNDLALLGIDTLLTSLRGDYPDLFWMPRILFGGILDIPDERGETREQAPVSGIAVDLLSPDSPERNVLNIQPAVVRGTIPDKRGDLLIADDLANRLGIAPGQTVTLISSTMYGSMAFANYTISGTVRFGIGSMDRAAVIADIADVQEWLDMRGGAGVILGMFKDDLHRVEREEEIAHRFNAAGSAGIDRFSPVMRTLRSVSGLSEYLDDVQMISRKILLIFIVAMSIVLWNAGLTGNLRRYGEIGLRLAVGEDTGHVYRSMMAESLMIGIAGTFAGTAIGLAFAYYLQIYGVNIGVLLRNSTMMFSDVIRAQVEPVTYVIGFLPGILATFLGSAVSGIGIYRRQTSQLFKELET